MDSDFLEQYFSQELFQNRHPTDPLNMLLTMFGERPGADIRAFPHLEITVDDVSKHLGLELRETHNFTFVNYPPYAARRALLRVGLPDSTT